MTTNSNNQNPSMGWTYPAQHSEVFNPHLVVGHVSSTSTGKPSDAVIRETFRYYLTHHWGRRKLSVVQLVLGVHRFD